MIRLVRSSTLIDRRSAGYKAAIDHALTVVVPPTTMASMIYMVGVCLHRAQELLLCMLLSVRTSSAESIILA